MREVLVNVTSWIFLKVALLGQMIDLRPKTFSGYGLDEMSKIVLEKDSSIFVL